MVVAKLEKNLVYFFTAKTPKCEVNNMTSPKTVKVKTGQKPLLFESHMLPKGQTRTTYIYIRI